MGGKYIQKKEADERCKNAWKSIRHKMLRASVRRIRRQLIEIVRQEGENKNLEGSGHSGRNHDSLLHLPITQ